MSVLVPLFRAPFQRIIVIGGCSPLGAQVAGAVLRADTHLLAPTVPVVLFGGESDAPEVGEAGRSATEGFDRIFGPRLQVFPDAVLNRPSVGGPMFVPACDRDVFILAVDSADEGLVNAQWNRLERLLERSRAPNVLCLVSDRAKSQIASKLASKAIDWRLIFVTVPYFSPPALDGSIPTFLGSHLENPLENVCMGVALGVTRVLRVSASQPVDIVPVDVAVRTALTTFLLFAQGRVPPSVANQRHVTMNLVGLSDTALVWGMVSEYLIDYLGRYPAEISKAIPCGVFEPHPTLEFNVHLSDLWNYGLSLTAPVKAYRSRISNSTKQHLQRFPHSTTMERMKEALAGLDRVVERIPHFGPNGAAERGMRNEVYLSLLRLLTADRALQPLLLSVNLDSVYWELYVKRVCVGVLQYVAYSVLNHRSPIVLPEPRPSWINDFIFHGPDRVPELTYRVRRVLYDLHAAVRSGQQPNGGHLKFCPGGTLQRQVAIVAQPHVQLLISKIAKEQNLARENVEKRAYVILTGIGDTLNHRPLRGMYYIMRKIFRTLYDRVNINEGAFDKLWKIFQTPRRTVAIIPSHRSYIDFLVVSYMMLCMGLPPPHICSGEDFLRLGQGLSDVLRGSGAFFMRRSFRGDRLYGALFKEYVRHLTRDAQCIEFFIEGMRSRTGKTLAPRVGFLKMITDSFLEKQEEIDDVTIVTISLTYEKVLEGNVYANELLGIPKPKETLGNLFRSATVLKESYGALNVVVNDPISLASFVRDPTQCPPGFDRKPTTTPVIISSGSSTGGGDSYTPSGTLNALGWRIAHDLQQNLVITPTALLAAVCLHLHDDARLKEGVGGAVIASQVEWLRSVVLHRKGTMNPHFATTEGVHLTNAAARLLKPAVSITRFGNIIVDQSTNATKMLLSIYSNQLIHLFADEGVLCVAAFASSPSPPDGGTALTLLGAPQAALSLAAAQPLGQGTTPAAAQQNAADDSHPVGPADTAAADIALPSVAIDEKALSDTAQFLQALLALELPSYLGSPIAFPSWMKRTLENLIDDSGTSSGNVVAGSDSLIFRTTQFTSFVRQLLYPYIESYYVMLVVLTLLASEPRIGEDLLLEVAHTQALEWCRQKWLDFVQCSSKENLKNAVARYRSMAVVTGEASPSIALTLAAAMRRNGNEPLMALLRRVNSCRWHPATEANVVRDMGSARQAMVAAMHRRTPKAAKL